MQTQIFNSILRVDPTRTLTLRKRLVSVLNRKFRALKGLINKSVVTNDCFGINLVTNEALREGEFAFLTDPEKVQQFMDWFREQVELGILEVTSSRQIGSAVNAFWLNTYISTAYRKGMQRARTELNKAGYAVPTNRSIDIDFNLPVHADRVGLLYTRAYTNLKGITNEMDKQISDALAQGMAEGRGPREIARSLTNRVEHVGKHRATLLARTEIIRAHHHATIQEYENWGVVGVKVLAEWQTAGDARVCEKCNALARKKTKFGNGVYTLKQILPMIPAHPNCRCIALPLDITDNMDLRSKLNEE
jgi:SPP1 gp7 family putative phage head morphogenesis protein